MALKAVNATLFLGKVWHHYQELHSTNVLMSDWLNQNSQIADILVPSKITEGVILTTFTQTAGRGQMGNTWLSEPEKNIAFSILLQPNFLTALQQFQLNKAIALAVHDFIEAQFAVLPITHYPPSITIKWANDIYIGDQKVAGILVQNSLLGNHLQSAIVGIGLNINQLDFPTTLNATSLALATKHQFNLFDLVEKLTVRIEYRYLQLKRMTNFDLLHAEYLSKLYRFEEDATFIRLDGRPFRGKIVGVTEGGLLEILTATEGLQQFGIKEVRFEI
jgi:BirA family transcriptional regulator, biotin operon repressor / biotin---[acetyl-CoA-carboxylase] ligase